MKASVGIVRPALLAVIVAAALLGSGSGAAFAAVPSQPVMTDVRPSPTGNVTVSWGASTDASGHAITYYVYRNRIAVKSTNIGSSALVGTTSGTSITVAANSDEATQSYVWYYAVRADDGAGNVSAVSKSWAPDPHIVIGDSTECMRCHDLHGVMPYGLTTEKTSDLCYVCHGRADKNTAASYGDRSTLHVQGTFYDYPGQTAGSKHRNPDMEYILDLTTGNRVCSACHNGYFRSTSNPNMGSHIKPFYYNPFGVYDATQSFPKILAVQTSVLSGYRMFTSFTRASAPKQNQFCFACHGTGASTTMGYAGGPNAWGKVGGDHNQSGYDTDTAHGSKVISSNDAPSNNPAIQCLACHNKHASATTRLIDYRDSNTTDSAKYAGANICFACHSAASTETKVAAGFSAPFSWNDRDVKAEFTTRASNHPFSASSSGSWVEQVVDGWFHTTQADFETYTRIDTTATVAGDLVLDSTTGVVTPPEQVRIFGHQGGVTVFNHYDPSGNAWNTAPADNTQFSPGTGSTAEMVNGKVYVTRAAGTANRAAYDVASNTWAAATTLSEIIGVGGGSTINTRAADTCVYYTAAGGSNPRIMWWNYADNSVGEFNFQIGGTATNLGIGSDIAFAPGANRLFVINNNSATGDGRLYYRAAPGRATTSANFTQAAQVVQAGSTRYNRLTYFKKNGTEYLFATTRDTGGVRDGMVVSALSGTPAVRQTNVDPFAGLTTADGTDLIWDGGDYLYAFLGNSTTFRRALIPANPVTDAWTWTTMSASFTQNAGSSLAAGTYQPPDVITNVYKNAGTATTGDILPPAGAKRWNTVSWTEYSPVDTTFTVTARGWNGTGWVSLATAQNNSPIDLSAYSTAAYSKLSLIANLSTADPSATPMLYDWTVSSVADAWVSSAGSVTCVNCHNTHYTKRNNAGSVEAVTTGGPWEFARASDPDNTKLAVTDGTGFCLDCHDGVLPTAGVSTDTVVPYSVSQRVIASDVSPYFPGWNKSLAGLRFADSGHATTTGQKALCKNCHDPHASAFARLTAWTAPSGTELAAGWTPAAGSRANTSTALSREENLCYQCHGDGTTGVLATGAKNVAVKAKAGAQRHNPASATAVHEDTENAAGLAYAASNSQRHVECTDCHDAHVAKKSGGTAVHTTRESTAGAAVYGAIGVNPNYGTTTDTANWSVPSASTFTPVRMTGAAGDYEAYICLKCHSSNTTLKPASVNATYTDLAREFNPSNFSEHNVMGQSVGMDNAFTYKNSLGTTVTTTWSLPADSAFLVAGWTSNSKMTCTDCHDGFRDAGAPDPTTVARGPHGSTAQWLIDPDYTTWTDTTALNAYSTVICAKCHTNLATSNSVHGDHDTRGAQGGYCRLCHIKVPHGWKRPRMLGYTTDPDPYKTLSSGLIQIEAKNYTPGGWTEADCYAACSTSRHPAQSPAWP